VSRLAYLDSIVPNTPGAVCSSVGLMRYVLKYECLEGMNITMLNEYDQCV